MIFIVLIVLVLLLIYLTMPFKSILASFSASLSGLTSNQHRNICHAASKINGKIIIPGEVFSFNRIVGPRVLENGFVESRSMFEGELSSSVGGGICLVSSALYNVSLKSGMDIVQRVPHKNLIKSVPIGMDATVWYGKNDFRFNNSLDTPVVVEMECGPTRLNTFLKAKHPTEPVKISLKKYKISPELLRVELFRTVGDKTLLLDKNTYVVKR